MKRRVQLLRGGLLAATLALACGTDTIDLLPPRGEGAGASTGGSATSGTAGEGVSGSTGAAGLSGASGGGAGGAVAGGSGGSSGGGTSGCGGFGCGGFWNVAGMGGDGDGSCDDLHVSCPCDPEGRCGFGTKCDMQLGRCVRWCDNPFECGSDELLCEDHTCKPCENDQQCRKFGAFGRWLCVEGRCQECQTSSDCLPDTPRCNVSRCVECVVGEDCASGKCDDFRGRCL